MPKKIVKQYKRLVKCYKFKINFTVWEETYEDGSAYATSCPFVTVSGNEQRPRCDGLNEWGRPCAYVTCREEDPANP